MMRKRLVAVTLVGIVPLVLLVQWSDMVVGGAMVAGPYPPLAACLMWALLLAFLGLCRRYSGAVILTRGEMLTVFAIWAAANMVAGRGLVHPLLTSLAGPAYYARSGATLRAVQQHLPDWLAIRDRTAAVHFFEGYGLSVPWQVWRQPLLSWSLFLVPLITANVCLAALFELPWVHHERLAFPLVTLPMEAMQLSERPGREGTRAAVLLGVALPVLLHGFGVAHAYFPSVPCVPFFNDVSYLATTTPWIAARPLYVNIYPLLIGLTFLAPADVTLSVWFFLLVTKLELVGAAMTGWSEGASGGAASAPPYLEEQSAGAYLALAAALVWNARIHLATVWRAVASPRGAHAAIPAIAEARRYRLPAVGFVCGVAGVIAWSAWAGLPAWFAVAFFGFYFAVTLVLSRLMAESGIPWLLAPILPDKLILSLTGTAAVSQLVVTRLVLHVQHLRDTRQMLAPAVFQAGRLREEGSASLRSFYLLLLAAVFGAIAIGIVSALGVFYHHGALSLTNNSDGLMMSATVIPTTGINQLSSRLISPLKPSLPAAVAICGGAALTVLLTALRTRFLWWPLNPMGYALTGTLQTGYANKMLLSIMIGWGLKTLTLRFGGARGFRLLRNVALGLIIGDLAMGGLLKLLDALLGPSGYAIF